MKIIRSVILLLLLAAIAGCHQRAAVDITPHVVNSAADELYQEALILSASYHTDSTVKAIQMLDKALEIDSMNPDYYGVKAKWLCEMGYLDSALTVQLDAADMGAVTGEYLFQLGLFQAAKERFNEAHESFGRSNAFQEAILSRYPDSLGAYIIQQSAYACLHGEDSLFMTDIEAVRARFPERLMEIEMTRRLKPLNLIKQIRLLEQEFPENADTIPNFLPENN
ncbi:MAG: hypothetical protein GX042_10450 [Bacteroidales bacterium]|jgi:tetratricopeptide (TPR) repeat protein|nr:hypothetical protein [Bacteroidales bacterium]